MGSGVFARLKLLGLALMAGILVLQAGAPRLALASPSEDDFYKSLERHAQSVYQAHKDRLPEVNQDLWSDASRQAILRLRQAKFFFQELVDFAAPATQTFVISNVFSTFIAPPLFTALGHPEIGLLILAIPFEPFLAAGQVVLMKSWDDLKLLANIGVADYFKLKRLRRRLLEYPKRHHIITLIESDVVERVKAAGGPLWLSITKTGPYVPHGVQLSELEELAQRRPDGKLFLKSLLPYKTESRIYALELWYFINEADELRDELVQRILSRRVPAQHEMLSRQMHELIDLKRELTSLEKQVAATLKQGAKRVPFWDRRRVKRLSAEIRGHSIATSHAASQLETEILLQLSRAPSDQADALDSRLDTALDLVRKERDRLIRINTEAARVAAEMTQNPLADRSLLERSVRAIHLGLGAESGATVPLVLEPVKSLPPCPTLFGRFAL